MLPLASTTNKNECVPLLPKDRRKCILVADFITVQCLLVFVGSWSILYCVWSPDEVSWDYDILVRIMYLFDSQACGYTLMMSEEFPNLKFSNDTKGYNVIPIKWMRAIITVSTRLTAKTRRYTELSLTFHCFWMLIAIAVRIITKRITDIRTLNITLIIFFYSGIFMLFFDMSMALVYISHIKQSLTKGMVLRYSGWSSTVKLQSYDEFAGWLPIAASCCWLRGGVLFLMNAYGCRTIKNVRRKIKKREIKMKYENERFIAIPEAKPIYNANKTLIYRAGEKKPSHF